MNLLFSKGTVPAPLLVGFIALLSVSQLHAATPTEAPRQYKLAEGELDAVGKDVVILLTSRKVEAFAQRYGVTSNDWGSLIASNTPADDAEKLVRYATGSAHSVDRLKGEVQGILGRADALHLKFSPDDLRARVIPGVVGSMYTLGFQNAEATLPFVDKADVILFQGEEAPATTNNCLKITVSGLVKFPSGWRINGGRTSIQWTGFPTNVADAKTLRELAFQQKLANYEPITSEDDPTLMTLANTLTRFLSERDTNLFRKELLMTSDDIWEMIQKSGRPGPSRREVDEEMARQSREQLALADKVLKVMRDAGVDFSKADVHVQAASLKQCQSQGQKGSIEPLMGSQFKAVLKVQTDAKAVSGASLSGDYVLSAKQIMRLNGTWKVEQDLQWEKLPEGVIDSKTAAEIKLENYVAQHRALPPGGAAPEIEFTTVAGDKKMRLSDFKGKVVLLDFWATWCGPCQEPMAELQKIKAAHPGWGDKVVVIPVSIDDTMKVVREHLDRRGWTNTFNVWAGEGGWHSSTAKTYRVTSVPTTYILDPKGTIAWAGYPAGDTVAAQVDRVLRK